MQVEVASIDVAVTGVGDAPSRRFRAGERLTGVRPSTIETMRRLGQCHTEQWPDAVANPAAQIHVGLAEADAIEAAKPAKGKKNPKPAKGKKAKAAEESGDPAGDELPGDPIDRHGDTDEE